MFSSLSMIAAARYQRTTPTMMLPCEFVSSPRRPLPSRSDAQQSAGTLLEADLRPALAAELVVVDAKEDKRNDDLPAWEETVSAASCNAGQNTHRAPPEMGAAVLKEAM